MRICSSARRSRWNFERQLEALGDVDRRQQLDALLVVEVGAVAAGVREHARLADRAQPARDPRVVAAQLEDLLDHGAVLARQRAGARVDRDVVVALVDLDEQGPVGAGLGGADQRAMLGLDVDGVAAAGKADALGDRCDDADVGVLALVARDEHDTLVVVDGDRSA